MGKVHCEACKKSCKGQAIRLQDSYFHIKCFKCKECKKQLSSGGFYTQDGAYYCGEDYQKLFGTKCAACGKYVEGEVVTALGNTYHQTCFHCTRCNNAFGPGDKVTYTGKDYLCNNCLEESSIVMTPQSPQDAPGTDDKDTALEGGGGDDMIAPMKAAPTMASTPARPGLLGTAAPGTLGSPISDMSDIYTDKENLSNGRAPVMSTGARTSGYRSDGGEQSPRSHDQSRESRDSSVFDEFLNPQPKNSRSRSRGGRDSGYMASHEETLDSVTDSVFAEHTDTDRTERLSPMQNMMLYRSASPCTSTVSKSSRKSRIQG